MAFADIVEYVPENACETVSGQYVDVVSPDPNTIVLTDIAWSLSRQARFAGHTLSEEIWSVAQHSVFVLDLIDTAFTDDNDQLNESLNIWIKNFSLWHLYEIDKFSMARLRVGAILHDATEAYLVDLPSPVKRHEALREPYKKLERGLQAAIETSFNLKPLNALEQCMITWADLLALQIEAAVLMPSRGRGWSGVLPKMNMLDIHLFPMQVKPWRLAYDDFMKYTVDTMRAVPFFRQNCALANQPKELEHA